MKRIVVSFHWPKLRARSRRFLATGRAYLLLSLCSMILFVILGLGGMLQNRWAASPVHSMKGFAASVSGSFFSSLLGMELPRLGNKEEASPFKTERMASFLLRFLTNVNPDDPKSLLAMEMPGGNADNAVLFRPGSGGQGDTNAPEDHGPPGDKAADSQDGDDGSNPDTDNGTNLEPTSDSPQASPSSDPEPTPAPSQEPGGENRSTEGRKVVFIYHSHNRESFFPELPKGSKDANSSSVNITLVGKRLADQLADRGIGTAHSSKDYASSVQDYDWNKSYKYSKQTITQAVSNNGDLKFFFDIHRDSSRRKNSTATINGKTYAQVFFIIGERNPGWKENEKFANAIHEKLESQYYGLSRGIWGKTAANGNGEYNQTISPDSVLIEIGGVDNTLAECYRTADVLAKVISDLYWEKQDAVEAGTQPADGGTKK